jgi:hypothetical protein
MLFQVAKMATVNENDPTSPQNNRPNIVHPVNCCKFMQENRPFFF